MAIFAGTRDRQRACRLRPCSAQLPAAISLLDVVSAVEGPILDPLPGIDSASEEVITAWRKVARSLSESLADVSIQSILDESAKPDMYFI